MESSEHIRIHVLQGTRDAFATRDELENVVERIGATATLHWLVDANHSFEIRGVKRTPAEVGASLAPTVAGFLRGSDPTSAGGTVGR
ncbi:alpha/beta family hydrolase [Cryobacterium tagatosivorans]|uniref:KANL3/Tex30 alpha/beta hydrolase-like domain-containing protein n=1 Tax=Cryobacterium tagatosivorans TaxID=1259199 RepID=A0A4V3I6R1_9MICO|nr:alpha/beta family hydrolase [Cryobacterium tagatosivorans]TFB54392.1 hypothetical protein E3O23_03525 [Cryobacterium tagatosivorans]